MTAEAQLQLLPDEPPVGTFRPLPLSYLPSDACLPGPLPDKALVDSIRSLGILQPVLVKHRRASNDPMMTDGPDQPPYYIVIAGRRRVKAARKAELSEIPCVIYHEDVDCDAVIALAENACRSENTMLDFFALQSLFLDGYDEKEIAQATGLAMGTVRKRMKLMNLNEHLRQRWQQGEMTDSVAEAAASLTREQQCRLQGIEGKITGKHVSDAKQAQRQAVVEALPDALFDTPGLDAKHADISGGVPPLSTPFPSVIVQGRREPKIEYCLSAKANRAVLWMLSRGDNLDSLIGDRMVFLAEREGWTDEEGSH